MSPLDWPAPELYRAICGVTTRYTFTEPVSEDDLIAFRALLEIALSNAEHWVRIERVAAGVRVRVGHADRVRYERVMLVECGAADTQCNQPFTPI